MFGSYEDSELYSRNTSLIRAVASQAEQSVKVRPARRREVDSNHQRLASGAGLLRTLWEQCGNAWSLLWQRRALRDCDLVFVPYPAYLDMLLLRLALPLGKRPTIFVDAFLCLHDTLVFDRGMLKAGGVPARLAAWLEGSTLRRADLVFIDTEQQRQQLLAAYALPPEKVLPLPVGIDEALWHPLPALPAGDSFKLLFWGTFIPLHGIEVILRAAALLAEEAPDIQFQLVGNGQTADAVAALQAELSLPNLDWRRELLPAARLQQLAAQAHCLLGIFGDTDKAARVVPYKVYQALASNRPLITRRGPATEALRAPGLVLVDAADPGALAAAILELRARYGSISGAPGTRELYDERFSQRALAEQLARGVAAL